MSEQPNRFTAIFLLIVLSLIWGTSFILMKKGLVVFSPIEVGSIRVVAASIFLLPFAITRMRGLTTSQYGKLLLSGLLGIFFPAFLFATAQTRIDSSVSGIMNSLTPIFALLIGVFLFKQPFRSQSLLGIVIGLIGTFILVFSRADGQLGTINAYALLVVVACVFYGTNVNFIKFNIKELKAMTITSVSVMLIGPLALIFLFGFTDFTTKVQHHDGALTALAYLVLLGVMSTSVATILFNKLIKIATPLFAASTTYIIPIVAVMWGVLDGEKLILGHFIGMAAIIGGVYLANRR